MILGVRFSDKHQIKYFLKNYLFVFKKNYAIINAGQREAWQKERVWNMYHILVCDDEKDIVSALRIYLEAEGYQVFEAGTGQQALQILSQQEIHCILMDIMMPQMDGISAVAALRKNYQIPVILLTAKSEDTDKILGLNIGADDYVTKPFNPVEVLARVRSQIRRYMLWSGPAQPQQPKQDLFCVGPIALDDKAKQVTLDGQPVNVTPTEFDILKLLLSHPGQVLSPKQIYREVWNDDPYGADSTVAVHIRHLREKLEINPSEPRYLKVVWGQGYKLEEDVK